MTASDEYSALRARVQARLLEVAPDLPALTSRWQRRVRVRDAVARVLAHERLPVSPEDAQRLVRDLSEAMIGFGPLETLLGDPGVTEVMVNGADRVFVERDGRIEPAGVRLDGDDAVFHLLERIVAPLGLRVDAATPWVDARLPDGSRVHAIVPPLAVGGPAITIRRFPRALSAADLVERGTLSGAAAAFLRDAVVARRNVVVSGGAGAGKTTMLGVLCSFVPGGERIVTIEDTCELRLARDHVVALEARPPNVEGRGAVTIRDLVRNALRMRPDRIVVGEVRGGEALDMLQAMNSGHAGSMSTAHSNSPPDLLTRLEAMALMGEPSLSVPAARRQIASALDLVIHLARDPSGHRMVTDVVEVSSGRGGFSVRNALRLREASA